MNLPVPLVTEKFNSTATAFELKFAHFPDMPSPNFTGNQNISNAGMKHAALKGFCNLYSLTISINKRTCWKNPSKPSCIDLILRNRPKYFQNSSKIVTG